MGPGYSYGNDLGHVAGFPGALRPFRVRRCVLRSLVRSWWGSSGRCLRHMGVIPVCPSFSSSRVCGASYPAACYFSRLAIVSFVAVDTSVSVAVTFGWFGNSTDMAFLTVTITLPSKKSHILS